MTLTSISIDTNNSSSNSMRIMPIINISCRIRVFAHGSVVATRGVAVTRTPLLNFKNSHLVPILLVC